MNYDLLVRKLKRIGFRHREPDNAWWREADDALASDEAVQAWSRLTPKVQRIVLFGLKHHQQADIAVNYDGTVSHVKLYHIYADSNFDSHSIAISDNTCYKRSR